MKRENYAALYEFISGTPEERPVFDDWRRMFSSARRLARWFLEENQDGRVIGMVDERMLYFGAGDGGMVYDGSTGYQKVMMKNHIPYLYAQYLPPEILDGRTNVLSEETDSYLLAVLLFKLFFQCHPIALPDEMPVPFEEWREVVKTPDAFRFAPEANPVPRYLYSRAEDRWSQFPVWMQRAFARTFTEGITNPKARTSVEEWENLIGRLCASHVPWRDENGVFRHQFLEEGGMGIEFPYQVFRLEMEGCRDSIILAPYVALYEGDFNGNPGYGERIGEVGVVRDKENAPPMRLYCPWTIEKFWSNQEVAAKERQELFSGMRIQLNGRRGIVR